MKLVGYQVNFEELVAGLFLFNHECGTTLALPAQAFTNLYNGPVFQTRLTGQRACRKHCLKEDDLGRCPAKCECAFVREIVALAKEWPKREQRQARE